MLDKGENKSKYSLLNRYINIITLIFLGLIFYFSWKITKQNVDDTFSELEILSQKIENEINNKENKKCLNFISKDSLMNCIKNFSDKDLEIQDNYYYAVFDAFDNEVIANSNNFKSDKFVLKNLLENKDVHNNFLFNIKNLYILKKLSISPLVLIVGSHQMKFSYKKYIHALIQYKFEILFFISFLGYLSYLFYISILQPFTNLSKLALAISNEELEVEIPKVFSSEGEILALALEKIKWNIKVKNELSREVLETRNKLARTSLMIETKVNERTSELEKFLKTKIELFDHLNHELILPIQGIYNIAENIVKFFTEINDHDKINHINQISYTAKRISKKIADLLDLSKFSTKLMELSLIKFELIELTQEVIDECQIMYGNQKKIKFHINCNHSIYITADKGSVAQLLFNLFINAIKFSPFEGDIAVNIFASYINIGSCRYEAVHFAVIDKGTGLNESEISSLFIPFVQGKNFIKKSGSIGLGLSICKEIILAHNGKIWANNNKDGGAEFNFILPIIQPKNIDKNQNNPCSIDLHYNVPNILMIDDEDVCLNSMELILYSSNYNLIKANGGQAGIKYLNKHYKSISLILLDLMMPDMYGLNVLAEIKNSPKLASIPVILQTGTYDEGEIVKAFQMGVNSFIRKPYNKEEVIEEIRKSLIT